MNPSSVNKTVYDIIRERLRAETLPGTEPPRMTQAEILLCELVGDLRAEMSEKYAKLHDKMHALEARIYKLETHGDAA